MKSKKTIFKKPDTKTGDSESAKTKIKRGPGFPIVGIGASAGGLEALEQFFEQVPKDNEMAFVVIQHLDPNHIGIMPELLQRTTHMKVYQVTDLQKVKPDCVYVIPPNKSMSLLKGTLHLFDPVESRGLRLPIDIFFRSMAIDRMDKSIGIILSGMGSDGSLGLKAIKEHNGIVLVQDPSTAKFDAMPRNAIDALIPDIVAPARELPEKLLAFLKYQHTVKPAPVLESKIRTNIEKIIILLREQTGHDFSLYKKNTLFRRIERRKGIHQIDRIQNYVRFLQENPKEIEILYKELLIGVTSFFRDPAVWDNLKKNILPEFLNKLPDGYVMRLWVPACSTGEEAYSLAIVLKEVHENLKIKKRLTFQIFATDIDKDAIEKARKGGFSKNIAADISSERLKQFFTLDDDGYKVVTSIREMVIFAPQNVIKDPPFTKLDFISCRNLMIYMESELQKKLIELFKYSLNSGGLLLLGTAETLGTSFDGIKVLDPKLKLFKRTLSLDPPDLADFPSSFHTAKKEPKMKQPVLKTSENIQTIADQILLQQFSPASVLVNENGDIIYITGRTGKYLEPAAGKANWNIHAMARDGLRQILPGAFRKASKNFSAVIIENIKVGFNGGTQYVNVTVQRLEKPEAVRNMLMVIFSDVPAPAEKVMKKYESTKTGSPDRLKELETELERAYEDLQGTREEMQTSQEELKSTNEELQSTNEELQSTNEELTTSKEEMQSLNEELQTVNIELQSKINDFSKANNDIKNLLNSTEIATLFLDKELHIRRFTDYATRIFKLRDTDINRPFTDLVSDLKYPEIADRAQKVIETLVPVEDEIETKDKRWFKVRIMPYRTLDDRIDGVVMTFTDITIAKKLEMELRMVSGERRTAKG